MFADEQEMVLIITLVTSVTITLILVGIAVDAIGM